MIVPTKTYEKPDSGLYNAILADVVDLGMVTQTYNGQSKTVPCARFVWFLANDDGTPKLGKPDPQGKVYQLSVTKRYNISSLHEKSNVYKDLKQILGQPPAANYDLENAVGLIRKLLINRETSADGQKDYANIMGYLPAPGAKVPVPADFKRVKDRPAQGAVKATPVTPATPVQTPAAQSANVDAAALIAALKAQIAATQSGASQGPDAIF